MDTNNILALLEQYTIDNPDDVAMEIANDFRRRRIEGKEYFQDSEVSDNG